MADQRVNHPVGRIGRRTGENVIPSKHIRKEEDGTDCFDDYWTESEDSMQDDSTSLSISHQCQPNGKENVREYITGNKSAAGRASNSTGPSSRKKKVSLNDSGQTNSSLVSIQRKLGRRTGTNVLSGKKIRRKKDGTQNFDDYWTDGESIRADVSDLSLRSPGRKRNVTFEESPSIVSYNEVEALDKACNTSRDAGGFETPVTAVRSGKSVYVARHSSMISQNEEPVRSHPQRSSPRKSSQSKLRGTSKNKEQSPNYSQRLSSKKSPLNKSRSSLNNSRLIEDTVSETELDDMENEATSFSTRSKNATYIHHHSSISKVPHDKEPVHNVSRHFSARKSLQNEIPSTSSSKRQLFKDIESESELSDTEDNDIDTTGVESKTSAYLHPSSSSLIPQTKILNASRTSTSKRHLIEESVIENELGDSEGNKMTSTGTQNKDTAHSNESQNKDPNPNYLPRRSPRKSTQNQILKTSRPSNTEQPIKDRESEPGKIEEIETSTVGPADKNSTYGHLQSPRSVLSHNKESGFHNLRFSPRSSIRKSEVTEELESEDDFDNLTEKQAAIIRSRGQTLVNMSLQISQNKVATSPRSLRKKGKVIEDSENKFDNAKKKKMTSLRFEGERTAIKSPQISLNKDNIYFRSLNLSKVIDDPANDDELKNMEEMNKDSRSENDIENMNEGEMALIQSRDERSANRSRQILQNNNSTSSPRSLRKTSKGIEDSESENDIDNMKVKEMALIKSTGVKSANKSRQILQNNVTSSPKSLKKTSKVIEDSESENDIDMNEEEIALIQSKSERSANKCLQNKDVSKSLIRKSRVIEDSESENDIDNASENEMVLIRYIGPLSANKYRQMAQNKVTSSPRSVRKKSKVIEDSESENDIDNGSDNEMAVIRHKSPTSTNKSRQSSQNTSSPRSVRKKGKVVEDSERENYVDNVSNSELASGKSEKEKAANKSVQISQNKVTKSPRKKRKVIEDSDSENDTDNVRFEEIASIKSMGKVSANKSRHILESNDTTSPRSLRKKGKVIEDSESENDTDNAKEKQMTSIGSRGEQTANKSRQISRNKDTSIVRSPRNKSKVIEDPVSDDELNNIEGEALTSIGNQNDSHGRRHSSTSATSRSKKHDLNDSQSFPLKKKLQKRSRTRSRVSRYQSKIIEDSESDSLEEREAATIQSRIETATNSSRQLSQNVGVGTPLSQNKNSKATADPASQCSPPKITKKTKTLNTKPSGRKRKKQVVAKDLENEEAASDPPQSETSASKAGKSKKTKRDNAAVETLPGDLRRSGRNRIRPLEYWRGERRMFKYQSGDAVCEKLIPGIPYECDDLFIKNQEYARQNKLKQQERHKKIKNSSIPKTAVRNPHTEETIEVNLHRPFNSIQWSAVAVDKDAKIPYFLTKTFSSERLTFGFLDIRPHEVKSSQYSPEDNIQFTVLKGHVKAVIRKTELEFRRFDSFIVPNGEAYSIQNLAGGNALLSFCTFKIPFFEYQCTD